MGSVYIALQIVQIESSLGYDRAGNQEDILQDISGQIFEQESSRMGAGGNPQARVSACNIRIPERPAQPLIDHTGVLRVPCAQRLK